MEVCALKSRFLSIKVKIPMIMIYYLAFTTICTILLWWWVYYRITHPFTCTCGFKTRFSNKFKKHVLQGHRWG